MPFYHDHTYRRVQLEEHTKDGHSVMWELVGPFNGDFVAGIVAGIYILLKDHVINYGDGTFRHRITVHVDDTSNSAIYVPLGNDVGYQEEMAPYLGHIGIAGSEIGEYQAPPNGYGWWIKDQNLYDMYVFSESDFVQGFISVCDSFDVDFRNYIAGPPFSLDPETGDNISMIVTGYDIAPFHPPQIVGAAPAPYYTMVMEGDIFAVNFV